MSARVLGIDIGSHGAIALLTPGDFDGVVDMPILRDGPKGRPNVSAALLADIVLRSHATMAYVEFVSARPGEGAVGAFAFGRSRGVIEGVCGAVGVPVSFLTLACWKRPSAFRLDVKARRMLPDRRRSDAGRRTPRCSRGSRTTAAPRQR